MWRNSQYLLVSVLVIVSALMLVPAAQAGSLGCGTEISNPIALRPGADPVYDGHTLTEWLKQLDAKDLDGAEEALAAIAAMGPAAWPAVPVLEKIVAAPFKPIEAGTDDNDTILTKLLDIELRADAVDALAEIGPAATCATNTLVDWALTVRVQPSDPAKAMDNDAFLSIMAVDVLERMRVSTAVQQFGAHAAPILESMLRSGDAERRKLAVSILDDHALPVILSLVKSSNCEDKKLGLSMLVDMWTVVARVHIDDLKTSFACDPN